MEPFTKFMFQPDAGFTFDPYEYRIEVPSLDSLAEGYAYSGLTENGGILASPDKHLVDRIRNFTDSIVGSPLKKHPSVIKYLNDEYNSILNSIGITGDGSKADNLRPIGMDTTGKRQFSTQNMMASQDGSLGDKAITSFTKLLNGFNDATGLSLFGDEENSMLLGLGAKSKDPELLSTLDTKRAGNDSKGFIESALDEIAPNLKNLAKEGLSFLEKKDIADLKDSKGAKALAAAYQGYALYEAWDYLSPAQKSLGVGTLGLKASELSEGTEIGKKVLVEGSLKANGDVLTPDLTVSSALDIFGKGLNAYGVAKNWGQLSDLSKLVYGTRTVGDIASVAKTFNLLGSGTSNAAVAVSEGALAGQGYGAVSHMGIGAIAGPASAGIPSGYTAVAYADNLMEGSLLASELPAFGTEAAAQVGMQGGKQVIAVPTANANTASGAMSTAGSVLNTAVGVAGIAAGAYQIYEGWGTGGSEGAMNGALGGASMAAGLYALGATNPFLLAGVVAASALTGLIKAGKHEHQKDRDMVRARFQEVGLADENFMVKLADGTKVDIGIDGRGNMHEFMDASKVIRTGGDPNYKLHAYDVDYTNDVAYAASLGGVSLSRLITGQSGRAADQMGGQLANAFISNVDFQDGNLTKEKFTKIMANQRSAYSQAGIKSKSDAYALANQMYAEGRINDFELTQMHQSFNMMYNEDSWNYAQTLFAGRWNGIEVANENAEVPEKGVKATPARGAVKEMAEGKEEGVPAVPAKKEEEEEETQAIV